MSDSLGPWKIAYGSGTYVVDSRGDPLATLHLRADRAKNAALIAAAPEMLALLRDLEWAGNDCGSSADGDSLSFAACPDCGAQRDSGHSPGCKLAAMLARLSPA